MNVHNFCSGLESAIFNVAMSAQNARAVRDEGGQNAVELLVAELRRERARSAQLRTRLAEVEGDLAIARETVMLLA